MTNGDKPYFLIGSLEKGLKIMEFLAEHGEASVSQVAAGLKLNRSAAHRFLATLHELGYLNHDARSVYRLSFRVFEMGMRVVNAMEVTQIARPFLMELAQRHNETVNLGRLDHAEVMLLDRVESRQFLRIDLAVGTRVPVYATALGKAILAHRPEAERRAVIESLKFRPFTGRTVAGAAELGRQLEAIRREGLAEDREELRPDMRCVAAPIVDYTGFALHALSVSGPSSRMTDEKMPVLKADLTAVARALSARLGGGERRRPA